MSVTMLVRTATEHDWATLRAVRLDALGADPTAFASSVERARLVPEAAWRAQAELRALACVDDDRVVGMIGWSGDPVEPELISTWVHPDHRGRGVSEALVVHVVTMVPLSVASVSAVVLRLGGTSRGQRIPKRHAGTNPLLRKAQPLNVQCSLSTLKMRRDPPLTHR